MTYQCEEDLDRSKSKESETHHVLVDGNLDGHFTETRSQHDDDDDQSERDEDRVEKMRCSLLGDDLSGLGIDLYLGDIRAFLCLAFLRFRGFASPPDQFHELGLNLFCPLHDVESLIVPNDKKSIGSNEGSELMFPSPWKILDRGQNLDSEAVHQWHVDGVW